LNLRQDEDEKSCSQLAPKKHVYGDKSEALHKARKSTHSSQKTSSSSQPDHRQFTAVNKSIYPRYSHPMYSINRFEKAGVCWDLTLLVLKKSTFDKVGDKSAKRFNPHDSPHNYNNNIFHI
jgi:hypothetical protein